MFSTSSDLQYYRGVLKKEELAAKRVAPAVGALMHPWSVLPPTRGQGEVNKADSPNLYEPEHLWMTDDEILSKNAAEARRHQRNLDRGPDRRVYAW